MFRQQIHTAMIGKVFAIVLVAFCVFCDQADAQACVARSVVNLTLDTHYTLSWSIQEDETCEINMFWIFIYRQDHPIEYSFTVNETRANVSFLEVCEEWTFVVMPVSPNSLGREQRLVSYIPLPADADLSISSINITRLGPLLSVHLQWGLSDPHYGSCTVRYRLTVEKDGEPYIDDMYLDETQIDLSFLSGCTTYQFGVRAINVGLPTKEGPLKTAFHHVPPARQGPPRLVSATSTTFGFNMTWAAESLVRNNCRVSQLYIDGGVLFRKHVAAYDERVISTEITALRPNTMYYFRAYISNSAGLSAPTAVAMQTLDFSTDEKLT